jgi:hypothetical protein
MNKIEMQKIASQTMAAAVQQKDSTTLGTNHVVGKAPSSHLIHLRASKQRVEQHERFTTAAASHEWPPSTAHHHGPH